MVKGRHQNRPQRCRVGVTKTHESGHAATHVASPRGCRPTSAAPDTFACLPGLSSFDPARHEQ